MDTLAIIPARGGSKGILRKNLCEVGGVPLVVRAIQVGLAATKVCRVIVTTDDDEIADVSRSAGAEVLMRPQELAADDTPTLTVLQFVLEHLKKDGWLVDIVVLLEPTSPFRSAKLVDTCIAKFEDPQVNSVVTVTQLERNPYNIFKVNGDQAKRLIQKPVETFSRRQQFIHLKRVNGCIYATRVNSVSAGRIIDEPLRVVEMSAEDSVHIDTSLDLAMARFIAKRDSNDQFSD